MPTVYGCASVICPYYHEHSVNSVTCEGPEQGMLVRLLYDSPRQLREQMRTYCCSREYEDCPLAKIAQDKYDHP